MKTPRKKQVWKRLVPWAIALVILAALVYAFLPKPVEVDTAEVTRGPMRVTVDEDGRTRVRERYIVSAPLNGRLQRIALEAGDPVAANETVLAVIEPSDPALLNPRARAEAQARVSAAEAALRRADPELASAAAELEFARAQLEIRRRAGALNATSALEMDQAMLRERTAAAGVRAAEFARDVAQYELELARAALVRTDPAEGSAARERFEVRSPISGVVLRVLQESAMVVTPGTPLVEVGDPRELEVEVDVLSRDAVAIAPGAPVLLEHWGGERPLEAVVRLVEPAAFTKVSALGVEEQRVNVIIDFPEGKPPPPNLGDAYRVEARIVVWQEEDAVQVPLGALFREGERWALYTLENGRAVLRPVSIGRRSELSAQVLEGVEPGATVIVHPGDTIKNGSKVKPRG